MHNAFTSLQYDALLIEAIVFQVRRVVLFRANEQGRFWLKFRCHFPVYLNRDPKPGQAFVLLQYNACQDATLCFMVWITRAFCP